MKTDKYKLTEQERTSFFARNSKLASSNPSHFLWIFQQMVLVKVLPDLEAAEKEIQRLKNVIENHKDNGNANKLVPIILCSKCFSFAVTIDGKICSSMKSGNPCRGNIHNLNVTRKDYRLHQENNTWHEIKLPPPAEG